MELPRLKDLYSRLRDRGVQLVALDSTADRTNAEKFIQQNGLDYVFLDNGDGDQEVVRSVFGVRTFPTTFIVDDQGRILFSHVGFEAGDEETFEEQILKILEG